jgi:hypothetical protein
MKRAIKSISKHQKKKSKRLKEYKKRKHEANDQKRDYIKTSKKKKAND